MQKNVAMNEVLKEIIFKIGMYEIKPEQILQNEKYKKQFEDDLEIGSKIGIKEAPAILSNGKIANGFLSYEELVDAIGVKKSIRL